MNVMKKTEEVDEKIKKAKKDLNKAKKLKIHALKNIESVSEEDV